MATNEVIRRLPPRPLPQESGNDRLAHYNLEFTVIGWLTAKAAEDCTHSRTLARGRGLAGAGGLAGRRTADASEIGTMGWWKKWLSKAIIGKAFQVAVPEDGRAAGLGPHAGG